MFGPDSAWIASAANDGTVRTYICQLCRRLPALMKLAEGRFDRLGQRLTPAERRRYLGG
jgi:hypothetical protein